MALQFLDKGNGRPIWILVNKPYEAVHLAMFFWCLLQEVDGERVDGECFSFHFEEVDGAGWRMILLPIRPNWPACPKKGRLWSGSWGHKSP